MDWPGEDVLDAIERLAPPEGPRRFIIDGPSGSGKTTLASALARRLGLPAHNVEKWVPGWGGLAAGSRVTEDLVSGRTGRYREWDWVKGMPDGLVEVDLTGGWIIEGCGALTPGTALDGIVTVWVEAEPGEARRRGLSRDGDGFASHWDSWHAQEVRHWAEHDPRSLAAIKVET